MRQKKSVLDGRRRPQLHKHRLSKKEKGKGKEKVMEEQMRVFCRRQEAQEQQGRREGGRPSTK